MADHRIVQAGPDDFSIIERIARATWPSTFSDILSDEQIEYMLNRMYAGPALARQLEEGHVFHLLLAEVNSREPGYGRAPGRKFEPVGYVSHQLDYLPHTTKIHKLYMLPGLQGLGYGRALIHKVAAIARRNGQQALRLDVNYRNRAVKFYELLGFDKIERHDTDIGEGFLMEDWVMVKLLN